MKVREVPGAFALGLLAALTAHAGVYGAGHSVGGAYHGFLVALAIAAAAGALVCATALAWAGAGHTSTGSVLAGRLRTCLPGWAPTTAAATLCFAFAEHVEPRHHSLEPLVLISALSLAAWLIVTLARAALSLLAAIAIAVRAHGRARRTLAPSPHFVDVPRPRALLRATRRFARPPPPAVTGA